MRLFPVPVKTRIICSHCGFYSWLEDEAAEITLIQTIMGQYSSTGIDAEERGSLFWSTVNILVYCVTKWNLSENFRVGKKLLLPCWLVLKTNKPVYRPVYGLLWPVIAQILHPCSYETEHIQPHVSKPESKEEVNSKKELETAPNCWRRQVLIVEVGSNMVDISRVFYITLFQKF